MTGVVQYRCYAFERSSSGATISFGNFVGCASHPIANRVVFDVVEMMESNIDEPLLGDELARRAGVLLGRAGGEVDAPAEIVRSTS